MPSAVDAAGPAELERLLARHDALPAGPDRDALAAAIDALAGQRHAVHSRLFWHRDLGAAKAVAAASGKPILSLRMLGRLDEELSCANSRFFRVVLRVRVHQWFADSAEQDLAALNRRIYAELFLTPADDPWLGMATPGAFTALPNDGILARSRD